MSGRIASVLGSSQTSRSKVRVSVPPVLQVSQFGGATLTRCKVLLFAFFFAPWAPKNNGATQCPDFFSTTWVDPAQEPPGNDQMNTN